MKKGKILSLTALMTIALNAPVFATNYTVNATPNIQTRETLENYGLQESMLDVEKMKFLILDSLMV